MEGADALPSGRARVVRVGRRIQVERIAGVRGHLEDAARGVVGGCRLVSRRVAEVECGGGLLARRRVRDHRVAARARGEEEEARGGPEVARGQRGRRRRRRCRTGRRVLADALAGRVVACSRAVGAAEVERRHRGHVAEWRVVAARARRLVRLRVHAAKERGRRHALAALRDGMRACAGSEKVVPAQSGQPARRQWRRRQGWRMRRR